MGLATLVEIGTDSGANVEFAHKCKMNAIFSCQQYEPLYRENIQKFEQFDNIKIFNSLSTHFLHSFQLSEKTIFFLNPHSLSGTDVFLGQKEKDSQEKNSFPLCDELLILLNKNDIETSIIIIDNARIAYNKLFQSGNYSPCSTNLKDLSVFASILKKFDQRGMEINISLYDEGYIIISSKKFDYFTIRAGDLKASKELLPGIRGVTGLSIERRLHDSRFCTRYLKGNCIDVGGGNDSLALYKDFFPLLLSVYVYDTDSGDGQELDNVPDNEFDCLFSSHCLEHLDNCSVALRNWIRVVKPSGYLVLTVPDEDLYEQGHWPSKYARQYHKKTFTLHKRKSWSPVSVNILDLVIQFERLVSIKKIELVDIAYHYALSPNMDQTRLPTGECSIEIILQKN